MPTPIWRPGVAPYALWLNDLRNNDPAAYDQHMLERRQRKSMKKAWQEVVEAQQAQWLALLNQATLKMLEQGIEGDVASYKAAFEATVGKPDSSVDITSNGNTIQAPTIVFTPRELDTDE